MARLRKIEIRNFRAIKEFAWLPSPGINCLVGPGDSGKSSVLDAIDACLGARRNMQFTDADFHNLDVSAPIHISITIGELDHVLKSMDSYGLYVRGFFAATGVIEDEPEENAETVLTLNLTVGSDLEPSWMLFSDRAAAQDQARNLTWDDRLRIAPTRIGASSDYHLGWRRGSVLNRLSEERPDASAALVKAAREARTAFGNEAAKELGVALEAVAKTAKALGVPIGEHAKAMLDAHSVSFADGTISLHDDGGVPLRGLGVGSARLLVAGLQREAAEESTVILIDELEHGLEPHRIIRLLGSLGAKENDPPLQAFVTTHSPVALRELSGAQLFVMRAAGESHKVLNVGVDDGTQSTLRACPDAFLAPSILVCEGASEVGLVRGLDQHRTANGQAALGALGVALVDSGGVDRIFKRANAFLTLGYRVAVVRDDDKPPTEAVERAFKDAGGKVMCWRSGHALEDELFLSLSQDAVGKLVEYAVELRGDELVDQHIKSASEGTKDLSAIRNECRAGISNESRAMLGKASKSHKIGWFKSVTWMEAVARNIVASDLQHADAGFSALIAEVFHWSAGDQG